MGRLQPRFALGVGMARPTKLHGALLVFGVLTVGCEVPPGPFVDVHDAMLQTYVHGVTDELAAKVLGEHAVPQLIELLHDPDFPRRDNVCCLFGAS